MQTTLEIPQDVVDRLRLDADNPQRLAERIVELIKLALLVEDVPQATIEQIVNARNALVHAEPMPPVADTSSRNAHSNGSRIEAITSIDPVTGLRVIESPPDAPIRSMSLEDILALEQSTLDKEDLQRAGIPL